MQQTLKIKFRILYKQVIVRCGVPWLLLVKREVFRETMPVVVDTRAVGRAEERPFTII